jgi:N4-gp56 family major capsid protein
MSGQTMSTVAARIGRWKAQILKHAAPVEVFGRVGVSIKHDLNIPGQSSDTAVYRRWLPKGATAASPNIWSVDPATHLLNEGETPAAETVSTQDITVQLQEYGVLYRFSNRVADMYEDDVPPEMKKIAGERMGLLMELIRYGQLKAGTNVYRAGAVASRALITGLISVNMLNNIKRGFTNNIAGEVTEVLSASPGVGTQPVEGGFIIVCSGDLENDVRALSGFIHASEYSSQKRIHEKELGSVGSFRFIVSPHMAPYLNAGAATTLNTRLAGGVPNTTGAELIDVYPFIVLSEQAFGDVMLRGSASMKTVSILPAGMKTKDDPLGQRGYVGASGYMAVVRLNEFWMAVGEVGASALMN